jgi:hypothetical protein
MTTHVPTLPLPLLLPLPLPLPGHHRETGATIGRGQGAGGTREVWKVWREAGGLRENDRGKSARRVEVASRVRVVVYGGGARGVSGLLKTNQRP